ncbi:mannosyltransferase family protein [Hyalangium rubrum]|uniref:Mannosyltransferase family protein n=1 Tax=Hyalangium rubrum TaxID=3103134 RepID=A0ABU5HAA0_9BACT|nr:mannosyltransferase family protein [Hyalangium sp. s54d21]MDY7230408.1 mannosyltransferase family protein [Hyalangium sp. s54d21]
MNRSAPHLIALTALGALLACTVAVSVSSWAFPEGYSPARETWSGLPPPMGWVRYDAGWYAHIATQGYSYTPGQQSPVAFFPAYPLVLRGLTSVGLDTFLAGVLFTMVCGVLALVLFTLWARTRADEDTVRNAGLLLALYPFAFFLYGAMYSDAFFLLLIVGAFLLLERGHLLPAVLLAAVATAARPVAPALVLGLLARRLEWKHERGLRWSVTDLLPVLAATGFLLYVFYLWRTFGEPMAFVKVQSAPGWDQMPGWRTWAKVRWFQGFFRGMPVGDFLRLVGHAAFTLGALALVWPTVKRLGWGYGLYSAAIVGLPALSSKDFMGMGRYLLPAFPLFLTLALLLRERPRLRLGVIASSAALMLALAAAFGAAQYVS